MSKDQQQKAKMVFNNIDKDGNGYISRSEMMEIMQTNPSFVEQGTKRFSKNFSNKSEQFPENSIKMLWNFFKKELTVEDMEVMIDSLDKNGDGKICFKEFCQLIKI